MNAISVLSSKAIFQAVSNGLTSAVLCCIWIVKTGLKASVEYENEQFQHLGSVVTNHGYSDWATVEIAAEIKSMWFRLSRRESDYCVECSYDGVHFQQMRICHLHKGGDRIHFGVYACSPENSSFTAVFTDMALTECQWQDHNGQLPD